MTYKKADHLLVYLFGVKPNSNLCKDVVLGYDVSDTSMNWTRSLHTFDELPSRTDTVEN